MAACDMGTLGIDQTNPVCLYWSIGRKEKMPAKFQGVYAMYKR